MTGSELADRLEACVAMGCAESAAILVKEHSNNRDFVESLGERGHDVQSWAYYASPCGSLIGQRFSNSGMKVSINVFKRLDYYRTDS